jgi:hypothetical protein
MIPDQPNWSSLWSWSAMWVALLLPAAPVFAAQDPASAAGPPTYYNDATTPGADPYVHYDRGSGYYYAYSTDGADTGLHFGIYRSPDLATWEHVPGGALPVKDPKQWGHDWFWAPEVYHNPETGLYFLFYAARMNTAVAHHFKYANFEEPCKVGVAVATSPQGPFHNIAATPIDYFPYDPAYHDINLVMDAAQKRPPGTREEGERAPRGTYIPYIDPNVFFDDDGRVYLYFSRNAYRNWEWDRTLAKYVEESNIYAVELDTAWWRDPRGATMPRIAEAYRNTHRGANDPDGVRRDGFTPIINYATDPQAWENAHVADYDRTGGRKKDRRWAEGSTTFTVSAPDGRRFYVLTYSANNFENEFYGVGYAVADSPLGPWRKSSANPILAQDPAQRRFSTGHGCIAESPDGRERFYVHHGRSSTRNTRRLYTERRLLENTVPPGLMVSASAGDEPLPFGVAPLALRWSPQELTVRSGTTASVIVAVTSAAGAQFSLVHPLSRLHAILVPATAGRVEIAGDRISVSASAAARLQIRYQRKRADGRYADVVNPDGRLVMLEIPIAVQK